MTRETVILVHGTFAAPRRGVIQWYDNTSNVPPTFARRLQERLCAISDPSVTWSVQNFTWDGKNDHLARRRAGQLLAFKLYEMVKNTKSVNGSATGESTPKVHLVAHSHGGNVVLESLHEIRENFSRPLIKLVRTFDQSLVMRDSCSDCILRRIAADASMPELLTDPRFASYRATVACFTEKVKTYAASNCMEWWRYLGSNSERLRQDGQHFSHLLAQEAQSAILGRLVFLGTPFLRKRWIRQTLRRSQFDTVAYLDEPLQNSELPADNMLRQEVLTISSGLDEAAIALGGTAILMPLLEHFFEGFFRGPMPSRPIVSGARIGERFGSARRFGSNVSRLPQIFFDKVGWRSPQELWRDMVQRTRYILARLCAPFVARFLAVSARRIILGLPGEEFADSRLDVSAKIDRPDLFEETHLDLTEEHFRDTRLPRDRAIDSLRPSMSYDYLFDDSLVEAEFRGLFDFAQEVDEDLQSFSRGNWTGYSGRKLKLELSLRDECLEEFMRSRELQAKLELALQDDRTDEEMLNQKAARAERSKLSRMEAMNHLLADIDSSPGRSERALARRRRAFVSAMRWIENIKESVALAHSSYYGDQRNVERIAAYLVGGRLKLQECQDVAGDARRG